MSSILNNTNRHRRALNEKELVFTGRKWCTLSSCLWASPFRISRCEVIGNLYSDLEGFFVTKLRVKTASASMLVKQLTKLAKSQHPPVEKMRQMLVEIGMMIAKSRVDDMFLKGLEELRKVKFLPIKVH